MRPRRGLVRDVYRAARSLTRRGTGTTRSRVGSTPWWSAGGSHTAGSLARKRRVERAAKALRRYRKSKRMKMTPRGSGGGLQKVIKCMISHKPSRYPVRGARTDHDIARGSSYVDSAAGSQGIASRVFFGGANTSDGTSVQQVLFNHGTTTSQAQKINRIFHSTMLRMDCVSACNNTMTVDAYILKCQRDVQAGMTFAPSSIWDRLSNSYPTAQAYTNVDEKPTYNPGFGSWWKIIKKTRMTLNPGQSFKLNLMTKEMWNPAPASLQPSANADYYSAIRGRSYAVMFVVKGMPIASSTGTAVNYGPCKMNYTWTWRCISSELPNDFVARTQLTNIIDPLGTIQSPGVLINDDDGTMQNYAKA